MDEFKKYIKDHRDELDVEVPPPSHIWDHKSATRQPLNIAIKWIAAACTLLLLTVAFYWGMRISRHKDLPQAEIINKDSNEMQTSESDSLKDIVLPDIEDADAKNDLTIHQEKLQLEPAINPPRVERKIKSRNKLKSSSSQSLEANYTTIINYQLKRLERTPIYAESADYFHVFKKQWYDMEKDEEKIKGDIQVYGLNDILVDQFIQLYQQKIGLLKQLQTEINKMNIKAMNNPDFRKQSPTYFKM